MQFAGSPTAQQVASALLDAGLAQQIATDILATGITPIDVPAAIANTLGSPLTLANNAQVFEPGFGTFYDVSRYQSLMLTIQWDDAASPITPAVAPIQYLEVALSWELDVLSGQMQESFSILPNDDRGQSVIQIPCLGTSVQLHFTNRTGVSMQFSWGLLGSYRSIAKPIVDQQALARGGGLGALWDPDSAHPSKNALTTAFANPIALPASGAYFAVIPPKAGLLTVTLTPDTFVSTAGYFVLSDHQGNWLTQATQMSVDAARKSGSVTTMQIFTGYHPVYIQEILKPVGPSFVAIRAAWQPSAVVG